MFQKPHVPFFLSVKSVNPWLLIPPPVLKHARFHQGGHLEIKVIEGSF